MPRIAKRLLLAAAALTVLGGAGWCVCNAISLRRARAALDRHDAKRGQELLEQCRWPADRRAEWHLLAGRAARMADALDAAESQLIECQHREGQPSEESTLEWALLQAQGGQTEQVEEFLRKKVDANHPQSTLILEAMARGYLRGSRVLDAMNCVRKWLERDPSHPVAVKLRGLSHRQVQAYSRAIDDFRAVLESRPDDDEARLLLADSLIQNSQAPDAVPYLEQLRARRSDDPDLLVKLAFAWNMSGRVKEARALLDQVIAEHPNLGPALSARGQIELQLQNAPEAERWLRAALQQTPFDRQTHFSLSQALHQQNKEKEAADEEVVLKKIEETIKRMLEVKNRLLPVHPTDPKLNHELGALMSELGHDQAAEPYFLRALHYDPNFEPAHRALAAYYEKRGDTQRAALHRSHLQSPPK